PGKFISSVQTQGSLHDAGLASLLQTMQAERATGTLSLENGADTCSLYFLFGHLFHASGPGGQGEDVVIGALGWRDGAYQFDPRAKLPAEETIKASPAELIAQAESREAPTPVAAGAVAADGPGWGTRAAESSVSPDVDGGGLGAAPPLEPAPFQPEAPSPAGSIPGFSPPSESGLASWAATQQEAVS